MVEQMQSPLMQLAASDLPLYDLAVGPPQEGRSPQWDKVRKEHVAAHPNCEACDTRQGVEVHHVLPFHLYPEFELVDANLMTLCRVHHYVFGHLMDWKAFNPKVRDEAATYLLELHNRPTSRIDK